MITNVMLLFYIKIYEEPSIYLQLLTCNLWDAKESQVGCKGSMTLWSRRKVSVTSTWASSRVRAHGFGHVCTVISDPQKDEMHWFYELKKWRRYDKVWSQHLSFKKWIGKSLGRYFQVRDSCHRHKDNGTARTKMSTFFCSVHILWPPCCLY